MATVSSKLAEELGLAREKNIYFGEYDGYAVSARDAGGQTLLEVGAAFESEEAKQAFVTATAKAKICKKLSSARATGAGVALTFLGGIGAQKAISAYLPQFWPTLAPAGARGAQICPLCGQELGVAARVWARVGNDTYCAHGGCLERRAQQAEEVNREAALLKKNVIPGALGAFLGAIVGVVPWVAVYLLGYIAVWCGLFIGLAAKKGYELLGGRPGKLKPWLIVVFTLVAFFFSFYLVQATYDLVDFFKNYEAYSYWGLTAFDVFRLDWQYFITAEFWQNVGADVAVGLIFTVAGCAGVFIEARKESRGPGELVEYITDRTGAGV